MIETTKAISKILQSAIYEIMDMRDTNYDSQFDYGVLIDALIALKRGVDCNAFAHIGRE